MQEIELKLQIPSAALPALLALAQEQAAESTRLRAAYFDTPHRHLASARAALRLRHEGPQGWVQTFKAQGATSLRRLEENLARGDSEQRPALDLTHYPPESEAGQSLARALGQPVGGQAAQLSDLGVTFGTDIQRLHWKVTVGPQQRSVLEFALDQGEVNAQRPDGFARQALCELELELISGEPADLLALAAQIVERHGLWIDMRSKAERGERLSRAQAWPEPASLVTPARAPWPTSPDERLRACQQDVSQLLNRLLNLGSYLAGDDVNPTGTASTEDALALNQLARGWHRALGHLHHSLSQAALEGLCQIPADWPESLALLLAPLDVADPNTAAVWRRAARSARYQQLLLSLLGWQAAEPA